VALIVQGDRGVGKFAWSDKGINNLF